jgi:hypothetical protein
MQLLNVEEEQKVEAYVREIITGKSIGIEANAK